MDPELIKAAGIELATLAAKNTASLVADRIRKAKSNRNLKEQNAELQDIINDLLDDKASLVRIAQAYEQELLSQRITEKDISYITEHLIPILQDFVPEEQGKIIEQLQKAFSKETLTILQLVGFNYKKAIGEPLTELVRNSIESKISGKYAEDAKSQQKALVAMIELAKDKESYNRFKDLTNAGAKMKNNPRPSEDIVLYESEDGGLKISVHLDQDTVWLSQQQLADLFRSSRSNIVEHIQHIYVEGELEETATCRNFRQVQLEGNRKVAREIPHYNLDMIISLGYRINSKIATTFRKWATERLKEYIVKGFTLDDERLKQNGGRYFKELLQRIRDIRSSERNLWQQVTDIYATSIDYDKSAKTTKEFFATVQNKMHYAVHHQTAAELIYNRVNSDKPMLGMTNFKGDYITKDDTHIAKNYLEEQELQKLNLLVEQYLGYAELQAMREIPMKMQDWKDELDRELSHLNFDILNGKGDITHKQAVSKADTEYDKYRKKEFNSYKSDFDRAIEELDKKVKKLARGDIHEA